jgi:hypothetical protein
MRTTSRWIVVAAASALLIGGVVGAAVAAGSGGGSDPAHGATEAGQNGDLDRVHDRDRIHVDDTTTPVPAAEQAREQARLQLRDGSCRDGSDAASAASDEAEPAQEQTQERARERNQGADAGNGDCVCNAHGERNQNGGTQGEPQQEQERNVSGPPEGSGPNGS